ncbi:MAG: YdcF family protein [Gammaproteobacteria bacterium]|nr:YdcF family protein [Gammaproteobacteria bacterium]
MDISSVLRSLVSTLVLPPNSLMLILIIGLLFWRRFSGRVLMWTGLVGLYLVSLPATNAWLAQYLEIHPAVSPAAAVRMDARGILVFMGDQSLDNPEYEGVAALSELSLQRMNYGLYLHRQTGLPLVLSGGVIGEASISLAELGSRWLKEQAGVEPLALETQSVTTRENAAFSGGLLRDRGLEPVLLVTHAYHMNRAVYSARASGLRVIPAPFDFFHRSGTFARPGKLSDWFPNAWSLAKNQRLLHEAIGLFWYRLGGR